MDELTSADILLLIQAIEFLLEDSDAADPASFGGDDNDGSMASASA